MDAGLNSNEKSSQDRHKKDRIVPNTGQECLYALKKTLIIFLVVKIAMFWEHTEAFTTLLLSYFTFMQINRF